MCAKLRFFESALESFYTRARLRAMRKLSIYLPCFICLVMALGNAPAIPAAQSDVRPAGVTGTIIVPDHFLRRWDPVTIFFARDIGPAKGGAEDHPDKWITMNPQQPGAFTWLDARTIQFRPSEPWPSLARFQWKVEELNTTLTTLMATPLETLPANAADGIDAVKEITLKFAEPLDSTALAQMLSIELRPLPGIGSDESRWIGIADFQIKTKERLSRQDPASYVIMLKESIPLGVRAILHFRLSLDDNSTQSFYDISFSTAEPFRATAVGCRENRYPLTTQGSRYSREQAINCTSGHRTLVVEFSATPKNLDAVAGRNLVRFTPAVPNLVFSPQGRTLEISGDFAWDTLYTVGIAPTFLEDENNRKLEMKGKSEVFLFFPRKPDYVKWGASEGIVERFGSKSVPVEGRGQERLDLRIYSIDPLDRSFWPFPKQPISLDESSRPPGPGEQPKKYTTPDSNISTAELVRQISALGSPTVSTLVNLPLRREGSAAAFGLDLSPYLSRIAGTDQPGAYLVGLRNLKSQERSWIRLQSTDLTLSTLEEPRAVEFIVTSLSTGKPVATAQVRIEGTLSDRSTPVNWTTLASGTTNAEGIFRWTAPGYVQDVYRTIYRIVIQKEKDILVLDAQHSPERYHDNQWSADRSYWLQWAFQQLDSRGPQPVNLSHMFTERPVYRPEEEVHIKGYLRKRERGRLIPLVVPSRLVINGPGDSSFKYPVTLTPAGSFYYKFSEKDLPTGTYNARLEKADGSEQYGSVSFQMEAYRLPRFEVTLHGPEKTTLDKEFEVSLTATYYAGGKVSGQPVKWRVTQFPYDWNPKKRPGFLFSTDARFSSSQRFQSTPRLEKDDVTGDTGAASLMLNPAVEPTAQPRSYVIEATVTGPDDQTVTATRSIPALPAFVLGIKAPRFLEKATAIEPEIIAIGPDDNLIEGQELTVRLLRREWHSVLRASDFSDGVARYLTDVVDEKISETKIKSALEPVKLKLPIDKAGVYIIEVEARDRLERAQVISTDLYAGGDQPVTWPKPVTRVFSVSTDKTKYDPGMTAAIILQSPFQNARALAIVEAPEGNRYQWIDVTGGAATFNVPIDGHFTPRLPVHFVLMRGRIPGTAPQPGNNTDLGKPATMAATAWIEVNPVANQMSVELNYPETARPGQQIQMGITLKDPNGKPLAGEVTLWLVDQAVLALGKEQRLDPVPDFIRPVQSHLALHDTRNLAFGMLPFAEFPGGDGGGQGGGLLDRTTIRRNFKTVPYYNPAIQVGSDGKTTVTIQLSDDLTNFKIRAKAINIPERFGFATGTISVRLPVIVQPSLPRFVRPGDKFNAVAIGRIVEGKGGPGAAEINAQGVQLTGAPRQNLSWIEGKPEKIAFPVEVLTPPTDESGQPVTKEVIFRMAVERSSDQARDAFEVKLPVRADREKVAERFIKDLTPAAPVAIPRLTEPARPGSVSRSLLISDQPGLIRMAAGLNFLQEYPYGCTEQQISRTRGYIAMRKFRTLLHLPGSDPATELAVKETLQWISGAIDANGLVAYWPGSQGYVSLTAWVVQFLVEAKNAGFAVDAKILSRLTQSLDQALRTDYGHFIDGEAFTERAWALAALAQAGQFNSAYAAELARKAQYLNLESLAQVMQAFAVSKPAPSKSTIDQLITELWNGMIIRLYQGKEIYGGLQSGRFSSNGLVLPSESRTLAETTRALIKLQPQHQRLPVLVNALVTQGKDDGWGTTNANASALLALSELLNPPFAGATPRTIKVQLDGKLQEIKTGPQSPVGYLSSSGAEGGTVSLASGAPMIMRFESSYIPQADGSHAPAKTNGFVITRELLRVGKPDTPPEKLAIPNPGITHVFSVGQVVEEHIQVVNPKDRNYVAVMVPLAAGMESLNPRLATAPPEAAPAGQLTMNPSYVAFMDDYVAFYYDYLPAGTYDFYFRTRASTSGSFVQPSAKAEMMYDSSVWGSSPGARINIEEIVTK
jgi:alpha-2-macroglobulin